MTQKLAITTFVVLFLLTSSIAVLAAPALPRYGINEQTKQCAEFFMGDECTSCTLPAGWQLIEDFQCPAGYEEIQMRSVCTPQKNHFCCTIYHSGSGGDCDDLVVNDAEKKCAFVNDINNCNQLPKGWNHAEIIDGWGRVCPSHEYEWLETIVDCEVKTTDNLNAEIDNDHVAKTQREKVGILVISASTIVLALLTIISFRYFKRKR